MINTYNTGDRVTITGVFKQDGVAGDPAEVRARYRNPEGTVTTLTYSGGGITRVSPGVYSFELLLNASGFWYYRMDDNGQNVSAESYIQVILGHFS